MERRGVIHHAVHEKPLDHGFAKPVATPDIRIESAVRPQQIRRAMTLAGAPSRQIMK
jgi:hypothetical protein